MLRSYLKRLFLKVSNLDWGGVLLLLAIVLVLSLIIALATAEGAELQWQQLGDYSGGINTKSPKGQLAANQYLSLQNFLIVNGGLECRKGFYKLHSLSTRPITFVGVFHKKSGTNHLIIGDGQRIWSSLGLIDTPKELTIGTYDVSTVDVDSAVNQIHGNSVSTQRWLAWLGSCEGCPITVGDTVRTISKIVLDTLIYTTVAYNKTQSAASYSLGALGITVNRGLTISDRYWLYTTNGRYSMDSPDSATISLGALNGTRYQMSTPYVARTCYNNKASLRFTSSGLNTGLAGYFLRLTSDQRSNVARNPIPAGSSFYMSYPIINSNATQITTQGAAFIPDSTATGAEYFTAVSLTPSADSLRRVVVDSVVRVVQDSAQWECTGDRAVYLKVYCDSCHWKSDTARFITGDCFVSPETEIGYLGSVNPGLGTGPAMTNRIIGAKYKTPVQEQIRATSMTAALKFGGAGAFTIKGAVYNASTRALVDTTRTLVDTAVGTYTPATITLTFASEVHLDSSTDYILCLWTSLASATFRYTASSGDYAYKQFGRSLTYTGSFPATLAPTDSSYSINLAVYAMLNYFENVDPKSKSGLNNAVASTCYPVVGGYVTSDSAILVASDVTGFPDHGQRKLSFFRMIHGASGSAMILDSTNYVTVATFEGRVFHVLASAKQTIYRSDLFDPDSILAATIILTDPSGEDITAMLGQSEYLKVYTANNRYVVTSTDGYTYTINKISSGVGCVAPKTLCEKDGVHYYLHYTGVYRDDGTPDLGQPISAPINDWFTDSIGTSQYDQAVATIYQGRYWISIVTKSNQKKTFVYDMTANAWTDMSVLSFASAISYGGDIDSLRFIFGSSDTGNVYAYGSHSDRGDSISAVVQSGYLNQDDPTVLKSYREVFVSGEKTSGVKFTLSLYLQPTAVWTSTAIVGTSEVGNYRVNPLQTTGKSVSVKLTIPNAYGYKHSSMRLGYVGQGTAN